MLDSVIRVNKKYRPQTLLEEYKYEIKKNKMKNLINDDLDLSLSDNESDNEYDNEYDNESDNDVSNDKFVNQFLENYVFVLILWIQQCMTKTQPCITKSITFMCNINNIYNFDWYYLYH